MIHSYTALHYGLDYLPYALRSVYDFVDKLHIVYTPRPSHGHYTNEMLPETRDQLYDAAFEHDPLNKIIWHDTQNILEEGAHRDIAVGLCKQHGAKLVLVLDADEVWPEDTLAGMLSYVWDQDSARNWLINFTSLWRSFDWVVRDDLWPVRFLDLRHSNGTAYVNKEIGLVYHFGYAVRDEIMRYKMSCHGHKGEWRPDWYDTKWLAWPPPPDCHPTNEDGFWNPEAFYREQLPDVMWEHPFWGVERIE